MPHARASALSPMGEEERALLKDADEGTALLLARAEEIARLSARRRPDTIASNYAADSEAGQPVYRAALARRRYRHSQPWSGICS
jgi:hypothetical protein